MIKTRVVMASKRNLPSVSSGSKENLIEISVCQALLLLLDHYRDHQSISKELKKLFFLGAQDSTSRKLIEKWMEDPLLKNKYRISLQPVTTAMLENKSAPSAAQTTSQTTTDAKLQTTDELAHHYDVINRDEVRRYAETCLAYETLLTDPMKHLSVEELETHCAALESLLPTTEACKSRYTEAEQKTLPATVLQILNNILNGDLTHVKDGVTTDKISGQEYGDALKQLESKERYPEFSQEQRKKMALLIRSSFLCVNIIRHNQKLPLSIPTDAYKEGYYDGQNRGAVKKESYEAMQSFNLGLMLSYMWLPFGDRARANTIAPYPRVPDRNTINPAASWVKDNFAYLVHPFSCSISGTMLIHCKVFKQLQNDGKLVLDTPEKFSDFLKSFVPLMLFNSGGHSFHEFMFPLSLQRVREEFSFIKGFSDLNNENLFMKDNEAAFNRATEHAIAYNKQVLARKELQASIRSIRVGSVESTENIERKLSLNVKLRKVETRICHSLERLGKIVDKKSANPNTLERKAPPSAVANKFSADSQARANKTSDQSHVAQIDHQIHFFRNKHRTRAERIMNHFVFTPNTNKR
jgi:hypothetical protein